MLQEWHQLRSFAGKGETQMQSWQRKYLNKFKMKCKHCPMEIQEVIVIW